MDKDTNKEDRFPEQPPEEAAKMAPKLDEHTNPATQDEPHKELKHSSVASINSIITSATGAVRSRMHTSTLGNTGTNISYEGATSNAAGGTGYNSGQPATGETIHTNSSYEEAGMGHSKHKKEKDEEEGKENEDENKS